MSGYRLNRLSFSRFVNPLIFFAGLAAVGWIGLGYSGSNVLALAVTFLICMCYVTGALELWNYQKATLGLRTAVDDLVKPPSRLGDWLELVHPGLRNAVRLRVEGERVALPGPALTPYLVGLLVLLGMLGTLLGMVATLRGTGLALDSATDLQAIRASLSAPIKGLGFAFGTSIAGVATSAMLGLLSALCRRERIQVAQMLDLRIASTLRIFSRNHQRDESFRLLQKQADVMPLLVDRLQSMMTAIEQQSLALSERQIAAHDAFHGKVELAYTRLAASVERTLRDSMAESVRAASAALQPVVDSTMAGIARESAALHGTVTDAVQRQLEGVSTGFEKATTHVATIWNEALAAQHKSSDALTLHLRESHDQFAASIEHRLNVLMDDVAARLESTTASVLQASGNALTQQERVSEALADHHRRGLEAASATVKEHAASLVRDVAHTHAGMQVRLEAQDTQRLAVWTETLGSMASTLESNWQQAGEQNARRQQAICDTLAATARDIAAQTQSHASRTIDEISRLVQVASQAPKAAAEIVGELRLKLSDSMVRDTETLEERNRLLKTLETLLDGVNRASTDQRLAIDALVATSAEMLERTRTQFSDQLAHETGKLGKVAAQVTGSAVEVASLGDAFGAAVHSFGESNTTLVTHLQRIESALDKSMTRSDEQLAYYVAQAREVIDLSMLSQRQIIEDLQRVAGDRASLGAKVQ